MQNQPTSGAEAAAVIAGVLPAVTRVELYPQWSDGTGPVVRRQRVTMYDAADRVIGTRMAARLACRSVMTAFLHADWDRPQTFDVAAGTLTATFPVVLSLPVALTEPAPAAGALAEQRHQLCDPAVPPLAAAGPDPDYLASVEAGYVDLPVWEDDVPAPARKVATVPVAGEVL